MIDDGIDQFATSELLIHCGSEDTRTKEETNTFAPRRQILQQSVTLCL